MIGLDTNVLVRYIMQDEPKQAAQATRLMESLTSQDRGYIPVAAILELFWVLTKPYALNRQQTAQAIELLLRTKEIVVDRAEHVAQALRRYTSSSADFADCLIACMAASAGCTNTYTFDVQAATAAGMTLVD